MNAAGDGTPGKYLEVFMEAYSDFARVYDIFMDNVNIAILKAQKRYVSGLFLCIL